MVNTRQTVLLGQQSSLWCQARGAPAPIITWLKDGKVLKNSTSVIYNLTSYDNNGSYTCVARNFFRADSMAISIGGQCKQYWVTNKMKTTQKTDPYGGKEDWSKKNKLKKLIFFEPDISV